MTATPESDMRYLLVLEDRRNRVPVLGRHDVLDHVLFGFGLQPMPEHTLRTVYGAMIPRSARILIPDEAAGLLAEKIWQETLLPIGEAYWRTVAWLRIAVKLGEKEAPLLHAPVVRAALLLAIAEKETACAA